MANRVSFDIDELEEDVQSGYAWIRISSLFEFDNRSNIRYSITRSHSQKDQNELNDVVRRLQDVSEIEDLVGFSIDLDGYALSEYFLEIEIEVWNCNEFEGWDISDPEKHLNAEISFNKNEH